MGDKKKVRRTQSTYNRQVLAMIDQYVAETENHDWQMSEVAQWAIANGLWSPPRYDPVKHLARDMQRAAREEYIQDENDEPVRRKHPYRIAVGDRFQTLWFNIEDTTPERVKLSAQQRRKGIAADVFQAERDIRYYNKNHNPGDPIQLSWNFDHDVSERDQPSDYDDTPPPDDES